MIPPRVDGAASRLTRAWFDAYCALALRRHFHAVRAYGDGLPAPGDAVPRLVVAATHQSFWDGLVLNWWLRQLGWRQRFAIIDARQVRRHPFFTRIGGIGVDLDDPADRARAVRCAAGLLRDATTPTAVVVFPQGRIEPADAPLDGAANGAAVMAKRGGATLVHAALAYEFWFAQRPEALVATGDSLASARQALREASAAYEPGRALLRGRGSIKDFGRRAPPPDEREARLR